MPLEESFSAFDLRNEFIFLFGDGVSPEMTENCIIARSA
jgi:hypothetical protein